MARLVIPEDFQSQLTLLNNIVNQDLSLGTKSPVTAFLTQQNIVLADDVTAGDNAQTHETNRALLSKQSQNYSQLRNNYFANPWMHVTGSVQFLKSFYKGNTKQLGSWGITITDGGKVNYPPAFMDRSAVFTSFVTQNNTYAPGTSPLDAYVNQQSIDFDKDAGFVKQANDNDTSFTDAAKQSENETELRNQLWQPVLVHIKSIGNFLMKLYKDNEKALGAWGFVVDDSAQKPKVRTSTLMPAETKTFNGILVGGTLTNTGSVDIHLYKGKSTEGTPSIIHPGEQMGMVKGYSSITVANPSTITKASFSALSAH